MAALSKHHKVFPYTLAQLKNYSLVARKKDKCHSVPLNSLFKEAKTVNLTLS